MKKFGKGCWKTYEQGIQREWVVTNGIGGYAGDSLIGAHTRKHHGLLVASLRPPVERYLVVSRVLEEFQVAGRRFSLAAGRRRGGLTENGQDYLQRFLYDGLPTFIYHVEDIHMTRTIAMEHGHNTTAIGYEIRNGAHETTLQLTPCFNYREHGEGSSVSDLVFEDESRSVGGGQEICLVPSGNKALKIRLYCSEGSLMERNNRYDPDLELQTEIDTGMSAIDNNYAPYLIRLELKPYEMKKLSVIATVEEGYPTDAFMVIERARERSRSLVASAEEAFRGRGLCSSFHHAGLNGEDTLFRDLVMAADCFIVDRQSTGYKTILAGLPWFTDWGRDTMIAMQGLTLVTGRYEDARGILRTFARYVKDGLVPNMFPDQGQEPLYNTVDASLWYFYSVDQYLRYTGDEDAYDFIKKEIYPVLKEIETAYRTGTLFSIYMDKDCLIHAGSGYDQITWMDVRVGNWVVTPRHGKPVEINALWYNALKVMEKLADKFSGREEAREYRELADRVREAFCLKFWNPEKGCLYDVVEEEAVGEKEQDETGTTDCHNNDQIRPNQIYAVSLPYSMLSGEQAAAVVNTVFSRLYATYGLRSLAPEDAAYKGVYTGALHDRDAAYHQGTVWAFPLGAFITAYCRLNHHSPESVAYARELLEVFEDHLRDGCIGQIAEIFDGDEPHISRGCYGQAWSVGEILRAYAEDILACEQ